MLRYILENRPLYRLVFVLLDVGFRRALFEQAAGIFALRATDHMTATSITDLFAVLDERTSDDSNEIDKYATTITNTFAGLYPEARL
jgi:hypothetical protein